MQVTKILIRKIFIMANFNIRQTGKLLYVHTKCKFWKDGCKLHLYQQYMKRVIQSKYSIQNKIKFSVEDKSNLCLILVGEGSIVMLVEYLTIGGICVIRKHQKKIELEVMRLGKSREGK